VIYRHLIETRMFGTCLSTAAFVWEGVLKLDVTVAIHDLCCSVCSGQRKLTITQFETVSSKQNSCECKFSVPRNRVTRPQNVSHTAMFAIANLNTYKTDRQTDNVCINMTLSRVRANFVAVEKK
jgi:hypothetical protein